MEELLPALFRIAHESCFIISTDITEFTTVHWAAVRDGTPVKENLFVFCFILIQVKRF